MTTTTAIGTTTTNYDDPTQPDDPQNHYCGWWQGDIIITWTGNHSLCVFFLYFVSNTFFVFLCKVLLYATLRCFWNKKNTKQKKRKKKRKRTHTHTHTHTLPTNDSHNTKQSNLNSTNNIYTHKYTFANTQIDIL